MKQFLNLSLCFLLLASLGACIGDDFIDDFVEPKVVINNPIDSLEEGTGFQFEATFFDNIGREVPSEDISWSSSNTDIVEISQTGWAVAKMMGGPVTITAQAMVDNSPVSTDFILNVGTTTVIPVVITRTGTANTTSSYDLYGDFELIDNDGDLYLNIADNYVADTALPGLYVYLSNNKNSFAEAYEIGAVTVFQGAHSYDLPDSIGINDYQYLLYFCKPFVAKVGHGEIL